MVAVHAKGQDKNKKGLDSKVFVPTRALDSTFVLGGRHLSLHPAVPPNEVFPSSFSFFFLLIF
jgi:hypothetical protein